ncbi:ATP/GTP-binding protein [Lacinutrix iliipiscaria]|uniref:ATP/GTP-binding protein n=1 Tax=Lacinutrix iliipiscaria TaxID=1230532 RepID=A0ABW5WQS5_9FLAO
MLVKFTVQNYLSFKNRTTIDLTATSLTEYRADNIIKSPINNVSLLKSLVLYGGNSSGKSNLFKAIKFVRRFILMSSKDSQADEPIDIEPFRLSLETINEPSYFEIEFIHESVKYRYGFEADTDKIYKEWLFSTSKNKEHLLFDRDLKNFEISKKFDETSKNLIRITRDNALFLSVCAQFNIALAIDLLKSIGDIQYVSGTEDRFIMDYTTEMLSDPEKSVYVNNFIKGANLGFNKIKTEKISLTAEMLTKNKVPKEIQKIILDSNEENTIITTQHTVYDKNNKPVDEAYFNLMASESLGTRKYYSLAGPIIDTLIKGKTLIIDEFDARLHPLLSKAIIQLFNSSDNNPYGAQLIFASHNSFFINSNSRLFRRDQIIMTDKDKYGITEMKSLYEKKIRKDASFEKDYLLGKYQGVPDLEISNQLFLFDDNAI